MALDPKFKKLWVKALESGGRRQTKHTLRDESPSGKPRYCCLGVACEVAKLPKMKRSAYSATYYASKEDMENNLGGNSAVLPRKFARKIGLPQRTQNKLALMNDDKGMSFKQIAAWIRKHL